MPSDRLIMPSAERLSFRVYRVKENREQREPRPVRFARRFQPFNPIHTQGACSSYRFRIEASFIVRLIILHLSRSRYRVCPSNTPAA